MQKTVLFLSRILLGCWAVIVVGFLFILLSNAPDVPNNAPFGSVSIKTNENTTIFLPNPNFTCTETAQTFQCDIKIRRRVLNLTLNKGIGHTYNLSNCRAQYDGQAVECQETGGSFAPVLADTFEITNLGLSPQELQAVRRDYRGINTLMELGEDRLFKITEILSLATGIIVAGFTWFSTADHGKALTSFTLGGGAYILTLLLSGQMTLVAPALHVFVQGLAIAAALSTALATTRLIWPSLNHGTKALASVISSAVMLSLCLLTPNVFSRFDFIATAMFWWTLIAISIGLVLVIAINPSLHNAKPTKGLISLGTGFGANFVSIVFFLYLLLSLGYAD